MYSEEPLSCRTGQVPRGALCAPTALAALVALALLTPGPAGAAEPVAPALGATVQSLLEHARAHSPDLAGMRMEATAAAERVGPAGALPDPMVRVELMDINNLTRTVLPTRPAGWANCATRCCRVCRPGASAT